MDKKLLRLEELAISGYKLGTAHRWVSCLASERIVGKYQRGATMDVANALNVTTSQIENLARAGLAYRELRRISPVVHLLRERYTISHFTAFADLMYQIEFDPAAALSAWLEMDRIYRNDHQALTVETFRRLMKEEFGASGKADWEIHLARGASLLARAANDYGIPDHQYQAAKEYLELYNSPEMREIVVKDLRTMSTNKLFAREHWSVRDREMKEIIYLIREQIDPEQPPMRIPVVIQIFVYFKDHPQDSDNIFGKPVVDGLKGWWIPDDTRECVRDVRVRSLVDKKNPRLVVRAFSLPGAQEWQPIEEKYSEE